MLMAPKPVGGGDCCGARVSQRGSGLALRSAPTGAAVAASDWRARGEELTSLPDLRLRTAVTHRQNSVELAHLAGVSIRQYITWLKGLDLHPLHEQHTSQQARAVLPTHSCGCSYARHVGCCCLRVTPPTYCKALPCRSPHLRRLLPSDNGAAGEDGTRGAGLGERVASRSNRPASRMTGICTGKHSGVET